MRKKKNVLIGALSIGLIAALAIGGTVAFLTDSEDATNRFSMGDLDIKLEEPEWDNGGDPVDPDDPDGPKTPGDGDDLLPGDVRKKDPTVTAVDGDSYMRVIMTIQNKDGSAITDPDRLAKIMETIYYADPVIEETASLSSEELADAGYKTVNESIFTLDSTRSADNVFYYNYTNAATGDIFKKDAVAVLFTNIVIPTDWNRTELALLGEYQIVLEAQAIQSANFASAADAYTALDGEAADGTLSVDYKTVGSQTTINAGGGN